MPKRIPVPVAETGSFRFVASSTNLPIFSNYPFHSDSAKAAAYLVNDEIFLLFNADKERCTAKLPAGKWNVCFYDGHSGTAAPISATVLVRA